MCAETEAIGPLSLSPEGFEDLHTDLLRWMGYWDVRRITAKHVHMFMGALSLYVCDSGIFITTRTLTKYWSSR